MKLKHPQFEKIDNIYINFLDEFKNFDWTSANVEIYFSSDGENYIANCYIGRQEINNEFYFDLLDIQEA